MCCYARADFFFQQFGVVDKKSIYNVLWHIIMVRFFFGFQFVVLYYVMQNIQNDEDELKNELL